MDDDDKRNMKHLPTPPLDLTFNSSKDGTGTPLLSALPNHFVIAYDDGTEDAHTFMERLKDFRDLQCCVCRKNDVGSRRIPLQCVYGDCAVSSHVGCAKWGAIAAGGVSRISFFPGDEESEPVSKMYCSQHLKTARINQPSVVNVDDDSSESEDDFDNAVLIDDTVGEIFDDDVDEPQLRPGKREEHFAKRKRDTKSSSLSNDFDHKKKGKSAYHVKKRLIQQTAKAMLEEYENELKAGKSFERVDKNLSGHWKKQVTKDVFKKSFERIDLKLLELKDKYALEDAAIGSLQEEEEPADRWSHLWVPHFTTPLELVWDTYESCSESEI
uniref:Uncharacterized protein n=1 Tax=Chaetoceros debilis TaxID=122233 RepID=A0A7S3Q325_9STRA